ELGIAQGITARHAADALADAAGPTGRAELERCLAVVAPSGVRAVPVTTGEAVYDGAAHSLAGMGVQFILIAAVNAAALLLIDRQRGLLKRVHAAPVSRATVIAARLVSGAIQALAVLVFLFVFGKLAMGVSIKGSVPGFALVAVGLAFMASAL